MSFNKDRLIRLMYERPVLWNHKHADYRSALLKQQAWNELAAEFQLKDDQLKKKWACARDTFRRELRKILKWSTETVPYVSKWPYFEKMVFLKDTMDARKSFIDETEEDETENAGESNSMVFDDNFTEQSDVKSIITQREIRPFDFGTLFSQKTNSSTSDPLDIESSSVKKRSAKNVGLDPESDDSSKIKKIPTVIEEDDDYHFVMSILPSLRKVSNKMKVRMDIMNIILAAEKVDK